MKFSIRFTVDEAAVGHVLAALNSHDGVVFDHLAIEPLPEFKALPKPAKKEAEQLRPMRAQDHVVRIMADGQERRFSDIEKALQTLGYKGAGSTVKHLSDKGVLARSKAGWWQLVMPKAERAEIAK